MLGLKHFRRAATTIAGIELTHRIRKGQFKLDKLRVKHKTAPEIWNAVLALPVIEGDFQAPNWLDLQRLHHNRLKDYARSSRVGAFLIQINFLCGCCG